MPSSLCYSQNYGVLTIYQENKLELKSYQEGVLERLSIYLNTLKEKSHDILDLAEIKKKNNRPINWDSEDFNFCEKAWNALNRQKLLPLISTKQGESTAPYKNRISGLHRPIPNICLKVPTGGGKTLLGATGIERINTDFFERNTGFVLWVVPSDAIYKQTLKLLSNRESLYRQVLDRASCGRVKILQKIDSFTPQDVENHLCVMLLMLQSAGRQSKETLRIFKNSGKFPYFFPSADNRYKNQKLLQACSNLQTYEEHKGCVKHSLGNVLKLVQPIIVIDEGHRAYTDKAKESLMDFNPRFILELSATPNKKEHHSNVLVSVSGEELKKEEMIKLPINIFNLDSKDWKKALSKSYEILEKLTKDSVKLKQKDKCYVRPIMLVRVERTGKDQRDKKFIHSEDVREYLIKNFDIPSEEIKVKSASKDELGGENLLSEYSRVKYIITKEALKEGWDCPFAYVLTILSKTKAPVAIEQMIGRVLRQPYTQRTSIESLNQCYVVCLDQEVKDAVEGVRKGLQNEGMDGLAGDIKTLTDRHKTIKNIQVKRRKPFRGIKIFLPKVLHRSGKQLRELSYVRDLISCIDWSQLKMKNSLNLDKKVLDISHTQLDIKKQMELISSYQGSLEDTFENTSLDVGFMCQRISDIIPNSWQAYVILDKILSSLRKKYGKEKVYANKFFILDHIRRDFQEQISQKTEDIFRKKLKNNEILFKLISAGDPDLNWEMAETLNLSVSEDSKILRKRNNKNLQLSLFEDVYEEELKFNNLEKNIAWYLDDKNSVIKWWHRIIERHDWHLQGWQKQKIYPDFLVCVKSSKKGHACFSILETKGQHLLGNPDTSYKKKLFDLFTKYSKKSINAGTVEIQDQKMTFDLILEDKWQNTLNSILRENKSS